MRTFPVVVGDPPANLTGGVAHRVKRVQIHAFLLKRSPQPLDKHVVQPPAFAVHGNPNAGSLQSLRPIPAGELAALVGVEDLRGAVAVQGVVPSAEVGDAVTPGEFRYGPSVPTGATVTPSGCSYA